MRRHTLTSQTRPSPRPPASSAPRTDASSSRRSRGSSGTRQTPTPVSCSTTTPCCPRGKQAGPGDARTSRRLAISTGRIRHCTLSSDTLRSRGSQARDRRTRALQERAWRAWTAWRRLRRRGQVARGPAVQPAVQVALLLSHRSSSARRACRRPSSVCRSCRERSRGILQR